MMNTAPADPMTAAHWPLLPCLLWVGTRSPDVVAEYWHLPKSKILTLFALQDVEKAWALVDGEAPEWRTFQEAFWNSSNSEVKPDRMPPQRQGPADAEAFTTALISGPRDIPEQEAELRNALAHEKIMAWGWRRDAQGNDEIVPVPAIEWETLRIANDGTLRTWAGLVRYREVYLKRETVTAIFPQSAPARPTDAAPTKRPRGRPVQYPWAKFFAQCEVFWDHHGGFTEDDHEFSRPAHLQRLMADWCNERPKDWRGGPERTQLNKRVNEFLESKVAKSE